MYEFLDRLITSSLPRVRDFNGIKATGFDGRGNYNLGVTASSSIVVQQATKRGVGLPRRKSKRCPEGGRWYVIPENGFTGTSALVSDFEPLMANTGIVQPFATRLSPSCISPTAIMQT